MSDTNIKNKSAVSLEFVKLVKENLNQEDNVNKLSVKDLKLIADVFVKTLVDQIKDGSVVSFTNNMTFKRVLRKDRTHKNPKTGEEVFKKAHYVLTMDVKPSLKKQFEDLTVKEQNADNQETL